MNIKAFVDESGIIEKNCGNRHSIFVISMLFVREDGVKSLGRRFKRLRYNLACKNPSLLAELKDTSEIKGSHIKETDKFPLYKDLIEKHGERSELGIIVLKNHKAGQIKANTARCFNYLIKLYMNNYFLKHSKFKDCDSIEFIVDERNVKTYSRSTMEEYLNMAVCMENMFTIENIGVQYVDSCMHNLVQLTDYIANTYYRYYHQKKTKDLQHIIDELNTQHCNGKVFTFPL